MKRLAFALVALFAFCVNASAQSIPVPSIHLSITGTVATITKIITAVPGKQIIVTSLKQIPVATSVVTYTYGTGTNCGTGTTVLTGAMIFAAGQVLTAGSGIGPVFILPQATDLCLTIATAAAPGSLIYTLF